MDSKLLGVVLDLDKDYCCMDYYSYRYYGCGSLVVDSYYGCESLVVEDQDARGRMDRSTDLCADASL